MTYATMLQAVVSAVNKARGKDDISTAINMRMAQAIDLWADMYEDRAGWLNDANGIKSAGIAAAIAAEVARLATLEIQTKASDTKVDEVYQRIVKHLRVPTEYGCALGGVILKPYIDAQQNIAVQYVRADGIFPLAFDGSGNMTEVALMEQRYVGKAVYTRLEVYSLSASGLLIENLAFKATAAGAKQATLGTEIALTEFAPWAEFLPEKPYPGVKSLPFGYFKMPIANTIDADSPLGMSVFGRAVKQIEEADFRYSDICWEYEATQCAVHLADSMLKTSDDGTKKVYPSGRERLYRSLEQNSGVTEKPLLDTFSPQIRATDLYLGYQNQLKLIEFNSGLAYGTISDPAVVDKTATEIRSSKQRLFALITDIQAALERALTDFAAAVAFWMSGGAASVSVPALTFTWDDSIVNDFATTQAQKLMEFNSGVIDAVLYHMAVYNKTEAEAIKLVADMEARKPKQEALDWTRVAGGGSGNGGGEGGAAGA